MPPLLGQSAILEKMDSKHEIVSKDEELKVLIDQIAKEADTPRADESPDPSHLNEWAREKAVKVTALQLGIVLQCNHGILLPQLVKTFEEELKTSLSQQLTERAMTGLPKSLNRWLHLQLEAIFSYHLQCGCATRKQGTLLYRTGSDLIKALTVALADANAKSQELKALSERVKALETTINETNEDALLKSAAITINEILLQSTRKQIESNADSPEKLLEIDLNHFIASIDPKLWEFITTITRRPRSQEPAVGDTLHSHTEGEKGVMSLCAHVYN